MTVGKTCLSILCSDSEIVHRGESRTAATSKMEHFVILVNGF